MSKRFQRDTESRYTQVARIYQNLFKDPKSAKDCDDLKEALRSYNPEIPNSENAAIGVLKRLNENKDPPFNTDDMSALRLLFIPPQPLSPAQKDAALALKARQFWKALVYSEISTVEELWSAIHDYDVNAGAEEEKALTTLLVKLVPKSTWTAAQLDSLVSIAVHEVEFRDLAWWDAFHDFW